MNMLLSLYNDSRVYIYTANGYLVTIIVFTPLHLPDILTAPLYGCPLNLEVGKLRC